MVEFSQLSGISRPTLSKYFNDPTSVRPSTRAQIEKALQRYDYRPNLFAVNLNKRRPKIIGMIVPDLTDPFFSQMVQHIEGRCKALGLFLLVLSSRGDAKLEARAIETLLSLKIAGAVMAPLGQASKVSLIHSLQARIPIVFLDSRLDETTPFVGTNNYQSVPLITEYLCRTGERPTFFEMPAVNHNASERRDAYLKTMERLGLQPEFITVPPRRDWRFEDVGYTEALRVIDSKGGLPSRTLLCANDRIAMGVVAAAFQRGLKVGREPDCHLRIAGHDDQPSSRYLCPPLTTVAQEFDRLGQVSLDLLMTRIDAGENRSTLPEQIRLDARLVMRASA
ncbi:LacI family DNA-binding transcriptional regulator [Lichenifustis flavocetrariae]|uniref:LacI family transcriptional regulator n=1 Tax=Lichenifustis flavocetrariae TaxID=2949735 RepID=A0AA41YV56_9HYPH|nr:LacI family DNA-binding transcriptional regulator [Lichenifustis flavocetrariae]MCW6509164.1 LacI family transcriptional regulator [Lichenifustis flavocetrariae]